MVQIFLSHTKRDEDCCDRFDRTAVREGITVFRSEFENIESPAWRTIKNQIGKSRALFLMVGEELVNAQKQSEHSAVEREKWKYTQNWIAYEIGIACQKGIDVWVVCDDVKINFPVPYLNNYEIFGFNEGNMDFYRGIFREYKQYRKLPVGVNKGLRSTRCAYDNCQSEFNLWSNLNKGDVIIYPTCLHDLELLVDYPMRMI